MPSLMTYGVAALLVASLALNVRLLVPRPAPPAPAARTGSPEPRSPAATPSVQVAAVLCQRRLDECQRQGWELAARAIADDHAPRPADTRPAGTPDGSPAAQAATLCAKAQASLRETWQRDRDKIAASLTHSLGDPAEQERNVAKELAAMREVVPMSDREAALLESTYRERRAATVAAARAALQKEPRDLGAVLDGARGLFAEEDALAGRFGGPSGREAWRAHELDSRTVLMAILAAMADRDWDESIRW